MTHETDFLELYRRLGLNPGCDLAELKQAYRRHVAALHPDRNPGRPVDGRDSARLQRLTAQYGAAMDFHRRHGRLPGAPLSASNRHAGPRELSEDVREAPDPFSSRANRSAADHGHGDASFHGERRRPRGRLAVLLILVALGVFGWAVHEAGQDSSPAAADEDTVAPRIEAPDSPAPAASADVLHVGMSADGVRAMEGEPLAMHGDLWEYGPSWIRFDHDEVVDWHSSPLRPLHTEAQANLRTTR